VDVRQPKHLAGIDGLVIPGGESTTMSMQLERTDLFGPVASLVENRLPMLGTCAGLILLASEVEDGRDDQRCFGYVDATVRRNGYGRQVDSFETDLELAAPLGGGSYPLHAVFIRAPRISALGEAVEVLAEVDGDPVLCRQGPVMVTSFHPELTDDPRVHQAFLELV
jgi:5'-phosphate synthase pdxT subunit